MKRHHITQNELLNKFFGNVGDFGDFGMAIVGAVAQSGERLICIQEVVGSIPSRSTTHGALV